MAKTPSRQNNNSYQSTPSLQETWLLKTTAPKPPDLTHDISSPTINLLSLLALTLFITLKGWGTSVPHLADPVSTPTHNHPWPTTHIDQGWETGVPNLAKLDQISKRYIYAKVVK